LFLYTNTFLDYSSEFTKEKTGIHGQLFEGKDDMVFVHLVSSPVEIVNFLSAVPTSVLLSNLTSVLSQILYLVCSLKITSTAQSANCPMKSQV
jgi:hypothetical protein